MTDVFAAAVDALHATPFLGAAGVYAAVGGAPAAVRVIAGCHDPRLNTHGVVGVRSPGWLAAIKRAEVAVRPGADDTLVITEGPYAGTYRIVGDIAEDVESASWSFGVRKVAAP